MIPYKMTANKRIASKLWAPSSWQFASHPGMPDPGSWILVYISPHLRNTKILQVGGGMISWNERNQFA